MSEFIITLRTDIEGIKHEDILHCQNAEVTQSNLSAGIQVDDIGPNEPYLMCEHHDGTIHLPLYHIKNVFELTNNEGLIEASKIKSEIDKARLDEQDIDIGSRYRICVQKHRPKRMAVSIWDTVEPESAEDEFNFYKPHLASKMTYLGADEVYLYEENAGLKTRQEICDETAHRFVGEPKKTAPWMKGWRVRDYKRCERCGTGAGTLRKKFGHENLTAEKRDYNEYIIICEHNFPLNSESRHSLCNWIALATPRSVKYCFGENQPFKRLKPRSVSPCPACQAKTQTTFSVYHMSSNRCKAIKEVLLGDKHKDTVQTMDAVFDDDYTDRVLTEEEKREIESVFTKLNSQHA